MRILFTSLLFIVAFSIQAQAPRTIALCPPAVLTDVPLSEWSKDLSRERIAAEIDAWLTRKLQEEGHRVLPAKDVRAAVESRRLKLEVERERTPAALDALAKNVGADAVIYVQLVKVRQADKPAGAVFTNPNRAGSDTAVELRLWVHEAGGQVFRWEGKNLLSTTLAGPRFGTTNRREMQGNPQDIGRMIDLANRKKAEWIGRAVWEAVQAPVKTVLTPLGVREQRSSLSSGTSLAPKV
jgi:hypothetical protein